MAKSEYATWPDELKYIPRERGDSVYQLDTKSAVVLSRRSGKLKICRCIQSEWDCQTDEDGDTWCTPRCTGWECFDIDPGLAGVLTALAGVLSTRQ
jgi:hypothetical protein